MAQDTQSRTGQPRKPRRRLSQWGLRSLLLLVTLIAVGFGAWHIFARPYQVQADIRQAIEDAGGRYTARPGPAWLQWILGEDVCQNVTDVDLSYSIAHRRYGFELNSYPSRWGQLLGSPPRGVKRVRLSLLRGLAHCPKLKSIYASGQDVTDEMLQHWRELTELQELDLSDTLVRDPATWPRFPLRRLDLTRTSINDQTVESIAEMQKLVSLILDETAITDEAIPKLLPLTQLEELYLALTGVTDKSCPALNRFPRLKVIEAGRLPIPAIYNPGDASSIRTIQLVEGGIQVERDDDVLESARQAVLSPEVSGRSNVELISFEPRFISELAGNEAIVKLTAGGFYSCTTDADLPGIATLPNLRNLVLSWSWITADSLPEIARCEKLESLDVSDTQIADAGLDQLASVKSLWQLKLNGLRITDAGAAALANIQSLEILELRGTAVTDAGLSHLARLPKLRTLRLPTHSIRGPGLVAFAGHTEITTVEFHTNNYGRWHAETRRPVPPLTAEEVGYFRELARVIVRNKGQKEIAKERAAFLKIDGAPPGVPVPQDDVTFQCGYLVAWHELAAEVEEQDHELFRWWQTLKIIHRNR